jgi:hypothetical protein
MANELSTKTFGDYNADEDFKDMRDSDLIMPRLRLCQHTSKQAKEGVVKAGSYYNSATNETVIAADKVGLVIPIMFWLEWNEWNPDKTAKPGTGPGLQILARSTDPNSEIAQAAQRFDKIMTPKGEKIRVTEYYSFLVLVPEYTGDYTTPMLLSFSRTSHKAGKQWLNRMRNMAYKNAAGSFEKVPMPCAMWELSRSTEKKDGDDFFVQKVGQGTVLAPDIFATTLQTAAMYKAKRDQIVKSNVAADKEEIKDASVADGGGNPDL